MSRSQRRNFSTLALLLAHHDGGAGLAHPIDPPPQVDGFLFAGRLRMLRLQLLGALVPVALDQRVHPHARQLVDADQHRLAGLPRRRVVAHEVAGHLVEPLLGGDDVVIALQLPLQATARHRCRRSRALPACRRCARSGRRSPHPDRRRGRRSRAAPWPRPPPPAESRRWET